MAAFHTAFSFRRSDELPLSITIPGRASVSSSRQIPARRTARVGVVGLGVGTLATYAERGDKFRFYDINPQVIDFADRYFTFLSDARERGAEITVVPGDARLSLEREPPQNFEVLVLDAFNGDSIPTHLLTHEAIALYLRHLRDPDGVLAVHISNRYIELMPIVRAGAEHNGLDAIWVGANPDDSPAGASSSWVLVARPRAKVADRVQSIPPDQATDGKVPVACIPLAEMKQSRPLIDWTDDYNNIVQVLKSFD